MLSHYFEDKFQIALYGLQRALRASPGHLSGLTSYDPTPHMTRIASCPSLLGFLEGPGGTRLSTPRLTLLIFLENPSLSYLPTHGNSLQCRLPCETFMFVHFCTVFIYILIPK